MKRLFVFLLLLSFAFSCISNSYELGEYSHLDKGPLTDNVVFGAQVNPYSLNIMRKAYSDLHPLTKDDPEALDSLVQPNYAYIRFLPADSLEYQALCDSELELFSYPLDYEIIGDVSDYHDPTLPEDQITWQYAVVPLNEEGELIFGEPMIPEGEILEEIYIPGNHDTELEDRAYEIIGNGTIPNENNKTFLGRIVYKDNEGDVQEKGVKGIKVRARNFLKIRTGYTDSLGRYDINGYGDLKYQPRFELRFENVYGAKIGHGFRLIMPSTMDMQGVASCKIDKRTNFKYWKLAVVNNAIYDWYRRSEEENLPSPPENLYSWVFEGSKHMGATIMLHHGLLAETNVSDVISWFFLTMGLDGIIYDTILNALITIIGPDISITTFPSISEQELYLTAYHELVHTSQFTKAGYSWFAEVFNYELWQIITSGGINPYGEENMNGSGPCGVAEAMAYSVDGFLRGTSHSSIDNLWLESYVDSLIIYQNRNGLTLSKMFENLTPNTENIQEYIEAIQRNHLSVNQ